VNVKRNLEKYPERDGGTTDPPEEIMMLPPRGETWYRTPPAIRDLAEEVLAEIKDKIHSRQIYLKPFFNVLDM
jgi:hypothetical protein